MMNKRGYTLLELLILLTIIIVSTFILAPIAGIYVSSKNKDAQVEVITQDQEQQMKQLKK